MRLPLPLAALSLFAPALSGQAGHWEGAIRHEGPDLLFTVDLDSNPDWHGSFSLPGQDAPPLPLSGLEIAPPSIRFDLPDLPGDPTYRGILGENGSSIKGILTQGEYVVAFEMRRTGEPRVLAIPPNSALTPPLLGEWTATLPGPRALRLVLRLRLDESGLGAGTLGTADRRARNLVLSAIAQDGSSLSFDVRLIGASFKGALDSSGALSGTWTQNGAGVPLAFRRSP